MTLAELESSFDAEILPRLHVSMASRGGAPPPVDAFDILPANPPAGRFDYKVAPELLPGQQTLLTGLEPWMLRRKLYFGLQYSGVGSRTIDSYVLGTLKGSVKLKVPFQRNLAGQLAIHFAQSDLGLGFGDADDEAFIWINGGQNVSMTPLRITLAIDTLEFHIDTVTGAGPSAAVFLGCYSEYIV